MLRYIPTLALPLLFLSCTNSRNLDVYYNAAPISPSSYKKLPEGQTASIIETYDPVARLNAYKKQGYVVIGILNVEGERIAQGEIRDLAAEKGASAVIFASKRTGSIEKSYVVPVYDTAYVSTSGTVSGTGYNSGSYRYSGNSTISMTSWESRYYTVGSYDMLYLFLAPKVK